MINFSNKIKLHVDILLATNRSIMMRQPDFVSDCILIQCTSNN